MINFNHDVFINSVYFKQGDISLFTESTPGKRKDILKALLKLDKWDDYQKKAKDYTKSISTKIEERKKNFLSLEKIELDIDDHFKLINNTTEKLNKCNKEYKNIGSKLLEKQLNYQTIVNQKTSRELGDLKKKYSLSKNRIKDIYQAIICNNIIIEKNTKSVEKYQQKLKFFRDKVNIAKGIKLDELRSKLVSGRVKENILKEQIGILKKNLKSKKECEMCLRPIVSIDEARVIKEKRRYQLKILNQNHKKIYDRLKKANFKFKEKESSVLEANSANLNVEKIKGKVSSLKIATDQAMGLNLDLEEELKTFKIKDLEKRIKELKIILDEDKSNDLKEDILLLENKLKKLGNKRDSLNIEYGKFISDKNDLLKSKDEQIILHKELTQLNNNFLIYDKLRHSFGKDGIQSIIIENVIDELENYSNQILDKICNDPTSISIQTQRQTDGGSWAETFDISVNIGGISDELESLSGGEEFRISLALRLALSKILSKRMGGGVVGFLLLDEVSSSLDAKGLDVFADIVKQLSSEMKVLIITHDNRLKDKFNDVLVVEKTAEGSRAII